MHKELKLSEFRIQIRILRIPMILGLPGSVSHKYPFLIKVLSGLE
jgi:hypothetical protein